MARWSGFVSLLLVLMAVSSAAGMAVGVNTQNQSFVNFKSEYINSENFIAKLLDAEVLDLRKVQNLTVTNCDNLTCFYLHGHLLAKIDVSKVPKIKTPFGVVRVTRVFEVPSGARITVNGSVIKVIYQNKTMLTIKGVKNVENTHVSTSINGWIESAYDFWISEAVFYSAHWHVPTSPNSRTSTVFLFPAIEQNKNGAVGYGILQPVLEWNNRGAPTWTIASWYGYGDYYFYSTPKPVEVGDEIVGNVVWNANEKIWEVETCKVVAGRYTCTAILTNTHDSLKPQNVALFIALEGYNVITREDLPGDTYFRQIEVYDSNGRQVNVNWNTWVDQKARNLFGDGLRVRVINSHSVDVLTPN